VTLGHFDLDGLEVAMADPVRKKPHLQAVREGNPGKRPLDEGMQLPPAEVEEPDWLETFPTVPDKAQQAINRRSREVARREWRRVVPVLKHTAGLAAVDAAALQDYCICVARIDQCERDLSRHGLLMAGERGMQKNGSATIVSQYRAQYKIYLREFGLSPSARVGITPPGGDDDGDDAFD
jgi:P27 family predicted phage terminase small subunit